MLTSVKQNYKIVPNCALHGKKNKDRITTHGIYKQNVMVFWVFFTNILDNKLKCKHKPDEINQLHVLIIATRMHLT